MVPQNRIIDKLKDFLMEQGVSDLISNCELKGEASWINEAINIRVTEIDLNKILIEMRTNTQSGFSQYKKQYTL